MTDIGYDTGSLRQGADQHHSCFDAVTALDAMLAAIDVTAVPLGAFAAGA
jgi:hypothetical protein